MVICKNGKEYTVTESREYWVLSRKVGGLSVEFKVSKDLCEDEAALRDYAAKEDLF